jgi:hypothetical protein
MKDRQNDIAVLGLQRLSIGAVAGPVTWLLRAGQFDPTIDHAAIIVCCQTRNRVFKKSTRLWTESPSSNAHERVKDRHPQQNILCDQKCEGHLGARCRRL